MRIWLVTRTNVNSTEMSYQLPNCAHIHNLIFVNVQNASIQLFLQQGGIVLRYISTSYALSYQTPFCQTATCSKSKTYGLLSRRFSLYCYNVNSCLCVPTSNVLYLKICVGRIIEDKTKEGDEEPK